MGCHHQRGQPRRDRHRACAALRRGGTTRRQAGDQRGHAKPGDGKKHGDRHPGQRRPACSQVCHPEHQPAERQPEMPEEQRRRRASARTASWAPQRAAAGDPGAEHVGTAASCNEPSDQRGNAHWQVAAAVRRRLGSGRRGAGDGGQCAHQMVQVGSRLAFPSPSDCLSRVASGPDHSHGNGLIDLGLAQAPARYRLPGHRDVVLDGTQPVRSAALHGVLRCAARRHPASGSEQGNERAAHKRCGPDAEFHCVSCAGRRAALTTLVQARCAEPVDSLGCCPMRRRAALAQSAERFTRNEQVVGSIPTGGSAKFQLSTMIDDQVRCM